MSEFLNTEEAAELLRQKTGTLANWRSTKKGPPYYKAGSSVLYKYEELVEWVEKSE